MTCFTLSTDNSLGCVFLPFFFFPPFDLEFQKAALDERADNVTEQ